METGHSTAELGAAWEDRHFVRYGPPYCLPTTHSPTLTFRPLVHIACEMSDDFEFAWLERQSFPFSALIPVSRCKRFRK